MKEGRAEYLMPVILQQRLLPVLESQHWRGDLVAPDQAISCQLVGHVKGEVIL
nr:hypothetical protein [Halomonas sp. UBA3074]